MNGRDRHHCLYHYCYGSSPFSTEPMVVIVTAPQVHERCLAPVWFAAISSSMTHWCPSRRRARAMCACKLRQHRFPIADIDASLIFDHRIDPLFKFFQPNCWWVSFLNVSVTVENTAALLPSRRSVDHCQSASSTCAIGPIHLQLSPYTYRLIDHMPIPFSITKTTKWLDDTCWNENRRENRDQHCFEKRFSRRRIPMSILHNDQLHHLAHSISRRS